jgi:hypothetical protein
MSFNHQEQLVEAKSDLEKHVFAADMATQHTPFILGETGY